MNISERSRKQLVLDYLTKRTGEWVNGPELANEEVGGSEGLKRLRELRADGHSILTRRHPDPARAVWQYQIIAPETIPFVSPLRSDAPAKLPDPPGYRFTVRPTRGEFGSAKSCPRCGGIRPQNCDRCGGFGIVPA